MTKFKNGDLIKRVVGIGIGGHHKAGDIVTFSHYGGFSIGSEQIVDVDGHRGFADRYVLVESKPTTFEVGKKYRHRISHNVYTTLFVGKETVIAEKDGREYMIIPSSLPSYDEVKPEDWRCLFYENFISSLGGESFSSKEEVEKKFSSCPNFIKAVRVDA